MATPGNTVVITNSPGSPIDDDMEHHITEEELTDYDQASASENELGSVYGGSTTTHLNDGDASSDYDSDVECDAPPVSDTPEMIRIAIIALILRYISFGQTCTNNLLSIRSQGDTTFVMDEIFTRIHQHMFPMALIDALDTLQFRKSMDEAILTCLTLEQTDAENYAAIVKHFPAFEFDSQYCAFHIQRHATLIALIEDKVANPETAPSDRLVREACSRKYMPAISVDHMRERLRGININVTGDAWIAYQFLIIFEELRNVVPIPEPISNTRMLSRGKITVLEELPDDGLEVIAPHRSTRDDGFKDIPLTNNDFEDVDAPAVNPFLDNEPEPASPRVSFTSRIRQSMHRPRRPTKPITRPVITEPEPKTPEMIAALDQLALNDGDQPLTTTRPRTGTMTMRPPRPIASSSAMAFAV